MQASDNGVQVQDKDVAGRPDDSAADIINFDEISQKELLEVIEKRTGKTPGDIQRMNDTEISELIGSLNNAKPAPAAQSADGSPAAPGAAPQEPAADEEETVTIKRSELGTFATGRSIREAVLEKLKGKDEADKTIAFFKQDRVPNLERRATSAEAEALTLSNENKSLKKQLEEYEAKLKAAPQTPAAPSGDSGIEIPDIPEDLDFFDPDHQEKVKKVLKLVTQKARPVETPAAAPEVKPPEAQKTEEKPFVPAEPEVNPFDEIRRLQANPEYAEFFGTKTDIEKINEDYYRFTLALATTCGIKDAYKDGELTPEAQSAINDYFNPKSERGDLLRNQAREKNFAPPEELPALQRAILFHKERSKKVLGPDGKAVPISEVDAVTYVKARFPHLFTKKPDPVSSRIEDLEARGRAVENRSNYAKEVPPQVGAEVNDIDKLPMAEYERLYKKNRKDYTPQEVEIWKKILLKAGFTEKQAEDYFKPPA